MAYTLLQYVNLVLTRGGIIQTDLTALTSNAQQQDVDNVVSAINEFIDECTFIMGEGLHATVTDEGSITLVTNDRDYAFASDFASLADDVFVDETNNQFLIPYPGGFEKLRHDQLSPDDFTGLPLYYAIDPETGEVYLDALVTSTYNGRVYKYLYNKETNFVTSSSGATFPFNDELMRRGIPAVLMIFHRDRRPEMFSETRFQKSMAMVAALLPRTKTAGRRYGPPSLARNYYGSYAR